MPIGNGKLFLPVKAEIRKKIKKEAGDFVHVILYPDNEPIEIPLDMIECLKESPKAYTYFNSLSEGEQKLYMQWIYSATVSYTHLDVYKRQSSFHFKDASKSADPFFKALSKFTLRCV